MFENHLRLRAEGKLEEDLQKDYADDVVWLCEFGILQCRNAVRESAALLGLQLSCGSYAYLSKHVEREYACLIWRAESEKSRLEYGAASFVIRNGKIFMQSIYYQQIARS